MELRRKVLSTEILHPAHNFRPVRSEVEVRWDPLTGHSSRIVRGTRLSAAGLAMAGLSFSIFLIQGGMAPSISAARAFTSAIPVELLIVPVGVAIAWLEFGRFLVLRRHAIGESRAIAA